MAETDGDAIIDAIIDAIMTEPEVRNALRHLFDRWRAEVLGHRLEDNVDAQILVELDREYTRTDPTNAFGLYESIKAERPDAWVSPEVSLRMFRSVEIVAREALNEATRI